MTPEGDPPVPLDPPQSNPEKRVPMTTRTTVPISVVKNDAAASGSHFFDPSALRFFSSRPARTAYRVTDPEGAVFFVFVTSEQFVGSDGQRDPRRYTVRIRRQGEVSSESSFDEILGELVEFQAHETAATAKRAALTVSNWIEGVPSVVEHYGARR